MLKLPVKVKVQKRDTWSYTSSNNSSTVFLSASLLQHKHLSCLCFAPKNSEIMEFKKSLYCPNSPFVRAFLSLSLLFPLPCNSPFLSLSFPSIATLFNYSFFTREISVWFARKWISLSPCTFLFLIYSPSRHSLYCNFPFFFFRYGRETHSRSVLIIYILTFFNTYWGFVCNVTASSILYINCFSLTCLQFQDSVRTWWPLL